MNPHAGSVRYGRSAGILPTGSGGILPPPAFIFKPALRKRRTQPPAFAPAFALA